MNTVILRPPLARSRDALVAGVCSGLSNHLGWPVALVRPLMVVLALAGGGGLLFYWWLWALVPLESPPTEDAAAVRRRVPVAALLGVLAVAGTIVASAGLAGVNWTDAEAIATAALLSVTAASGAAVAWSLAIDRHDPGRSAAYRGWTRIGASVVLLLAGALALVNRPSALNAVLGVGMVVLGVGVLAAPRVVTLWSD